MPLFPRRKSERRQWTAEPIIPPFPGATQYGTVLADDPSAALQVPAVWACVRLKADAVASMTLHRYRQAPGGAPVELPLGTLLDKPSADRTLPEWLFDAVVSSELRGNVWGRIVARDAAFRPTQIELVNPDSVKLRQRDDGSLETRFGELVVPDEDVWHLRGFSYPGSPIGLSTLTYAASTIGLAAYAEEFARQFFRDGAHPSAILTTDHTVDQEAARAIKDKFVTAVKGRQPVVLGLGIKYDAISVTPEESQFLATQQFSVSQIARVFGVPASLIGGDEGTSMTYKNVEQRSLDFLVFGVQPILRRIEAALSELLPPGEFVRFDTSSLLRTDAKTRTEVQVAQLASRLRTLDELRAEDGLPPLTDAELAAFDKLAPPPPTPPLDTPPIVGSNGEPRNDVHLHISEGAFQVRTGEQHHEHVVNVRNEPPPVQVELPAAAPVTVNVREAPVNVYSPVDVTVPPPTKTTETRRVERDPDGNIAAITTEVS